MMTSYVDGLPNEILAATLALLSSRELGAVALVSRRFYTVGVRVLYRLVDAARLPEHELTLECYHPSAKISTPYLACRHQGTRITDGGAVDNEAPRLADLSRLYTSFRPVVAAEEDGWPLDAAARRRRQRRRAETGSLPPGELGQELRELRGDCNEVATQDIELDEGEPFSQLCTVTNVVKHSARRGLFLSHVNTSGGVVRVWRKWLADMASNGPGDDDGCCGGGAGADAALDRERFLWVDAAESVGLRFRVAPAGPPPTWRDNDDEPAVSYTLVYQELVVRSSMLLAAIEAAASQAASPSTQAVIIAQFEGLVL